MASPSRKPADLSIDDITPVPSREIPEQPDAATKREVESLKALSFRQDIRQRRDFAPRLFRLTLGWLFLVVFMVLAQGVSEGTGLHFFRLHDNVLIALLSTATINVVGLFYVVAKYLFPEHGSAIEIQEATNQEATNQEARTE
jgi:hypothetical protein